MHEPVLLAKGLGGLLLHEFCHDSFSWQPDCSDTSGRASKGEMFWWKVVVRKKIARYLPIYPAFRKTAPCRRSQK